MYFMSDLKKTYEAKFLKKCLISFTHALKWTFSILFSYETKISSSLLILCLSGDLFISNCTNKMIFYLYKLFDDSCIWVFLICVSFSHSERHIQLENTPQNKWVGVSVVGQTSWMRPRQAELSLSVVISVFLSCRLDEVHP